MGVCGMDQKGKERKGQGKTQTRGNLIVKLMNLSFKGPQLQVNAGSWTVLWVGGRPGCSQEALPGKYCIYDNLPKEVTRILKFLVFYCDFFHFKQIFTSVPNFVFITLYSFK